MAEGSWQDVLASHPIFSEREFDKDFPNCLAQLNGELFLWDNVKHELATVNLKRLDAIAKGLIDDDHDSSAVFQTFTCSQPPHFVVHHLVFSNTGQYLALVGLHGVMVMEVPQVRGCHGLFGDGRPVLMCRTFYVAQRFLTSSGVQVCRLRWHPASVADVHLLFLTSDNMIRLYNVLEPEESKEVYPVMQSPASSLLSSRALSMASVEGAVDFDILPLEALVDVTDKSAAHIIFVLMETGDLCCFQSSLDQNRTGTPQLLGPLRMQPPAEDNYGVDACSLLCLNSRPPVVVVATASGKLYHCVVMLADDGESQSGSLIMGQWETLASSPEPMLYVFEGVDLALTDDDFSADVDGVEEDKGLLPAVHLYAAPNSIDCYYCSHSAGVHGVVLPWIQQMQRYCTEDGGAEESSESQPRFDELNIKQECMVEHLMTTRPFPDCPPCPVASVCTISQALLGQSLVCVTNTGDCLPLRLRASMATVSVTASAVSSEAEPGDRFSSLPLSPSPFEHEIRQLLARRASMPTMLHQGAQTGEMSQREYYDVTLAATGAFRKNHLQVFQKVNAMISARTKLLHRQKQQQERDATAVQAQHHEISARLHDLVEKIDRAKHMHEDLSHRLVAVLHKLDMQVPVESDAEIVLHKELTKMHFDVQRAENQLKQAKAKLKFYDEEDTKKEPVQLNEQKSQQLRVMLKRDSEDIAQLIAKVKSLQIECTQ